MVGYVNKPKSRAVVTFYEARVTRAGGSTLSVDYVKYPVSSSWPSSAKPTCMEQWPAS